MTTNTETVESICRELAERKVEASPDDPGFQNGIIMPALLKTEILDPRFDALRGEHRLSSDFKCEYCGEYETSSTNEVPITLTYCLRTDLGSMVRALSEGCRFGITRLFYHGGERQWWCSLAHTPDHHVAADIPELAAARALKEAVNA